MKTVKIILVVFAIFLALIIIVGIIGMFIKKHCKKKKDAQKEITFFVNGGKNIPSIVVIAGKEIPTLPTPIKDGYSFEGWFIDKALQTLFSLSTMPNNNITLYAKWKGLTLEEFINDIPMEDVEQAILTQIKKQREQRKIEAKDFSSKKSTEKKNSETSGKPRPAKKLTPAQKAKQKEKLAEQKAKQKEKEKLAEQKAKQKEKEKLAAQKAKEKEKEKLAAQKAKEKEKEKLAAQKAKQKEKEKLAAQKAKQKEKEKLAAQKAKEKAKLTQQKNNQNKSTPSLNSKVEEKDMPNEALVDESNNLELNIQQDDVSLDVVENKNEEN